jgi:hypothetical protein
MNPSSARLSPITILPQHQSYYIFVNGLQIKAVSKGDCPMNRIEKIGLSLVLLTASGPAFAGAVGQVPAPIAGVGIGAVVLAGLGYRALKRRINP